MNTPTPGDLSARHVPTPEEEAAAKRDDTVRAPLHPDTIRLNWLEYKARNGGMFLYNGVDPARERQAAPGLGLRPGTLDRTLREAIDASIAPSDWGVAALAEATP